MKGHIVKRGQSSWRIKLDVGRSAEGRRITRYRTVRATKAQTQAELARLLIAHDEGTLVEPSKATVAEYMRSWIETAANRADVSPKMAERYGQLIERQIAPRIGNRGCRRHRCSTKDQRVSNCGVGSGGFGLPGDVVAQHGVEGCDHLAHDGNDDDFGLF
ncbi:MAG: hypothetical protein WA838_20600, partial [Xanthobacteraceae bacterium]